MNQTIPTHQMVITGPISVELGRREFDSMEEAARLYPRQSFNINPEVLKAHKYGKEQIRLLIEGYRISYCDYQLVPEGHNIMEFPDGTRYATSIEFLGNNRFAKTIHRRLADAPR